MINDERPNCLLLTGYSSGNILLTVCNLLADVGSITSRLSGRRLGVQLHGIL